MNVFLSIMKHLLLFFFTNTLGVFIFLIALFIFDPDDSLNFLEAVEIILALSIVTIFITMVPYFISIVIIKKYAYTSLRVYAFGGALTPAFIYLLFFGNLITTQSTDIASLIIIASITVIGVICGLVYGVLDKKIISSFKIK